jgi:hypothetical protein
MGLTAFWADHDHMVYSLQEFTISSALREDAAKWEEEKRRDDGLRAPEGGGGREGQAPRQKRRVENIAKTK